MKFDKGFEKWWSNEVPEGLLGLEHKILCEKVWRACKCECIKIVSSTKAVIVTGGFFVHPSKVMLDLIIDEIEDAV